jgi:hypothetical protein
MSTEGRLHLARFVGKPTLAWPAIAKVRRGHRAELRDKFRAGTHPARHSGLTFKVTTKPYSENLPIGIGE